MNDRGEDPGVLRQQVPRNAIDVFDGLGGERKTRGAIVPQQERHDGARGRVRNLLESTLPLGRGGRRDRCLDGPWFPTWNSFSAHWLLSLAHHLTV